MKKLLLILLAPVLLIACNKDDEPPKTKSEVLSQATWKFSTATVGGSDVSSQLPSCNRDNTLKFNTNGTGTADEGLTKCNPGDTQQYALTWSFLSGETQLKVNPPLFSGASDTYTLVSLTDAQLVVSQVMNFPQPIGQQTVVITFIH